MAGEGGKKSDPTVPIIIGIVILLLIFVGGCNGVNLPVYNPGGGGGGAAHGSHYSGCDRYHGNRDCGGGDHEDSDPDRGSGHERRHHHPRSTETPDANNR